MRLLEQTLKKELTSHIPVWMMRQAGRYLPEYKEVRKKAGSFLDLCYNPKLATEVTLQPIHRFNMDAAILFSDILVIPHALGLNVQFKEGEGPIVEKIENPSHAPMLFDKIQHIHTKLSPVYETVEMVRKNLDINKTLIGFCGAPWTVALYMLDKSPSKDSSVARTWAYNHPEQFNELMEVLIESSYQYLRKQIEHGANVVQIFDSWAASAPPAIFDMAVKKPLLEICRKLKKSNPETPIILFPRAISNDQMEDLVMAGTGLFEGIGLDFTADIIHATQKIQNNICIQGNLDPALLLTTPEKIKEETIKMLDMCSKQPGYIANLGHGIMPHTPIENAETFIRTIQEYKRGI